MTTPVLSTDKAIELINFVYQTNYRIAPVGDGLFDSRDEAIAFVKSDSYKTEDGLHLCFDTLQGDDWESVTVSHDGATWCGEDETMGGKSFEGQTIEKMIKALSVQPASITEYNPYCPVELVFTANQDQIDCACEELGSQCDVCDDDE